MTDPLADFLTRLRNASASRKTEVRMPYSKMVDQVASLLQREGFLEHVEHKGRVPRKVLVATLKYIGGRPALESSRRVSRPGRRFYQPYRELRSVKSGFGISIISTSEGLLTNKEARKRKMGGEILCEVW